MSQDIEYYAGDNFMCWLLEKQIAGVYWCSNFKRHKDLFYHLRKSCFLVTTENILVICCACDVDMNVQWTPFLNMTFTGSMFFLNLEFNVNTLIERWGLSGWDIAYNVNGCEFWDSHQIQALFCQHISICSIYTAFIESVSVEMMILDLKRKFHKTLPKAKLIQDRHSYLTEPDKCRLGYSVAPFSQIFVSQLYYRIASSVSVSH